MFVIQANANLNELAKRLKQSETLNIDLQRRVDELNSELQAAHNDAQRTQAELARLRVSVGELQERSDALARENKQLSGKFVTDDFSGPDRTIGRVCVCLSN